MSVDGLRRKEGVVAWDTGLRVAGRAVGSSLRVSHLAIMVAYTQ